MIDRNYLKLKYHYKDNSGEFKVFIADVKNYCHIAAWTVNLIFIFMLFYIDWDGSSISIGAGIALIVMGAIILAFTFWIGYLAVGFILHIIIFMLMLISYLLSGATLIVEEEITE